MISFVPNRRLPWKRLRAGRDLAPEVPDSFSWPISRRVIPKEPVPHLEHMFFGLSKIPDRSNGCVCRYENDRGEYLEMEGSPRCGLPTIFDGDFTIYAASVIVAERRREHGVIRFSAVDSAEFSRLSPVPQAGRQAVSGDQERADPALAGEFDHQYFGRQLRGDADFRDGEQEPGRPRPQSDQSGPAGGLLSGKIALAAWIRAAIEENHALSLHRDYFRLRKPSDRGICSPARSSAGARWPAKSRCRSPTRKVDRGPASRCSGAR